MSTDHDALIEPLLRSDAFVSHRIEDSIEASVGFVGPINRRLFASLSLPTGVCFGSVLMCSSIHVDFTKNYRNEVLLGWALARAGFAVLRFHYRGSGHSDGNSDEITFTSMREDAAFALDCLRADTDAECVAVIGCRLGAIVAAATVKSVIGTPLVLWEPVIAGSDYIREALRARRLSGVAAGSSGAMSSDDPVEHPGQANSFEVHGSAFDVELVESLIGRTLAGELGVRPRPIMLLRASRQARIPPDLQQVLQGWEDLGFPVQAERLSGDLPWWFTGVSSGRDPTDLLAREGIAPTVAWIRERLVERSR